jgi:hypothetical protein
MHPTPTHLGLSLPYPDMYTPGLILTRHLLKSTETRLSIIKRVSVHVFEFI